MYTMGLREDLQVLLEQLIESENVYFQPPSNLQMKYPCIVYKRDNADSAFADNQTYRRVKRYLVTVIDRDPDSLIPDKVAALPMCVMSTHFTADNLHHDVFRLYF